MKFPFYKQYDAMDCGPTCLRMISSFFGKNYTLEYLRERSYLTTEGVSLLGISEAAEAIGFKTHGVKITWDQLIKEAPLPCILHWNQNHFVVIYKISRIKWWQSNKNGDKYKIHIADPAHNLITYTETEFKQLWTKGFEENDKGFALLLEPTPEFYQQEQDTKKEITFKYLLGYLAPYKNFIIQLFVAALTGTLLNVIFPFLTQSVVDYGISNSDLSFIVLILIAQLLLTLGQAGNGLIRNWIMLHVTTRISISLIANFLMKLMKLPISFFDQRMTGDIIQRIGDHNRIQSFLTGQVINIVFSILTVVIYSVIIAQYSVAILGVFFAGSALYISWIILFLRRRRELDYRRFQFASANQNTLIQLILGMQEIKLSGSERQKRWEWERVQAELFKTSIGGLRLNQNQQIGSTLIDQVKNVIISYLAARYVISGEMTLGMMVAIQYIIGQLNGPLQQFIGFTQTAQDAKISLERLNEIHMKDDEELYEEAKIQEIPENGSIDIENLLFQFEGPKSAKVLNQINVNIPPQKVTAIVGASGSGKTTLVKLLLGLYQMQRGDIKINDVSLHKYSPKVWRKNCGVVMQEGFIFSDTISNNITVGDEKPDRDLLNKAIQIANIKELVNSLPKGLNTKIGQDGHGLSSGQRQRILIARAVYKNPQYVFFDEATNSLDAENEKTIMENLNAFFENRTVIIVAHRLSTVKNADQILVLNDGELIERGNHEELVAMKGAYHKLVKDQLNLN